MDVNDTRTLNDAVTRLGSGERAASRVVFELLWPRLVAFASRALGPGPDADDAAQLALEKIFAQSSLFDSSRSALVWAISIASWECRTILRSRLRKRELGLDRAADLAIDLPGAEAQLISNALLIALENTLAELTEEERTTLKVAFDPDDLRPPSDAAFRKRKQRTLERLRILWRQVYGT